MHPCLHPGPQVIIRRLEAFHMDLKHRSLIAVYIAALASLLTAAAAPNSSDWPQWHGPHRDNLSPDTGLLQSWPNSGPPLAWKATGLGSGYSSVSIAAGRIFTMGDIADA